MIKISLSLAALVVLPIVLASHPRTFSGAAQQNQGFCSNPTAGLLEDYVDELTACYDIDGDGILNRTEMTSMIAGQICDHECPTGSNILQSQP